MRGIRRLPVVDGPRLVGTVTDRDLREAMPGHVTSLSLWEATTALAGVGVGGVMRRRVVTTPPDAHARDAASTLLQRRIGGAERPLPAVQAVQIGKGRRRRLRGADPGLGGRQGTRPIAVAQVPAQQQAAHRIALCRRHLLQLRRGGEAFEAAVKGAPGACLLQQRRRPGGEAGIVFGAQLRHRRCRKGQPQARQHRLLQHRGATAEARREFEQALGMAAAYGNALIADDARAALATL